MKRILSALALSVAMLAFATPSFAQSSAQQNSMSGPKTQQQKMLKSGASSKKCPAGMKYVKGYTKSNGKKVKGYCKKAK